MFQRIAKKLQEEERLQNSSRPRVETPTINPVVEIPEVHDSQLKLPDCCSAELKSLIQKAHDNCHTLQLPKYVTMEMCVEISEALKNVSF